MDRPYYIDWVDTSEEGKPEQEKAVTITANGTTRVDPDEGYVLSGVNVDVNVVPTDIGKTEEGKPEQEKTVTITSNGTTRVDPDEGYVLSGVNVDVNVVGTDIGKPYIDTSKMRDFSNFISLNTGLLDEIEKFDTSNAITCEGMFYDVINLESCPNFDVSNCKNFQNMFYRCTKLSIAPQFNTSKGTTFIGMFRFCTNLKNIPLLDLSNSSSMDYTFGGCTSLETVSLTTSKADLMTNTFQNCAALKNLTIGEGWSVNICLHYSDNLTVESLHGMVENLADLTGQTAKNFTIGATNLAKIDEEHLTMLDNKNWNYS